MKEKPPAFQFYPKDWLSDSNVIAMPAHVEGCYIRLISICWMEGSIPLNFEPLLKGGCQLVEVEIEMLKKCFKVHPKNDQLLIHFRLEKERKKQKDWKKKSSEGGKKSAKLRKQKALENENGTNQEATTVEPPLQPKGNTAVCSLQSSSSSSKKHIKEGEQELTKSQVTLTFESRWLAYEGEKDNKKIAFGYWKGKVKTEKDVADYDQAVINYYAIVGADRKNGFPDRRLKGGKTWFNNYESYINQKPPAQVSKDGMQQQKQLDEKELQAYCLKQLDFVQRELAEGADFGFDWFHAALDKRVLEYEQRFGYSPFDKEQNKNYQTIREEMMGETE